MSAEVRQAWINAGDRVVANWPNLVIVAALGAFAWWSIRRAVRKVDQILHTDPPVIETRPGTDTDLLLDAALAYYGPAGLERLHDAINDIREEEAS